MYEHWADVQIDIAKTGNVLSYKIDTTPGEFTASGLSHSHRVPASFYVPYWDLG